MEKLKDLKGKHDHLLTKMLKVFLFSCVMIAPIVAGTSQMLYATLNKNAKDSYSADQSLNYTLVDTSSIKEDSLYYFRTDNNLNRQVNMSFIPVSSINTITGTLNIPSNPTRFRVYYNGNNLSYSLQIEGDTTTYNVIGNTTSINVLTFSFIAGDDLSSNAYGSNLKMYEFSEQQTLDNAFYYGMDKMAESDMFSWTKNTGIYTGINAMTTGMDINTENNILAILLTYWLLMTAIYVVIDIIIELFVKLTHLLS